MCRAGQAGRVLCVRSCMPSLLLHPAEWQDVSPHCCAQCLQCASMSAVLRFVSAVLCFLSAVLCSASAVVHGQHALEPLGSITCRRRRARPARHIPVALCHAQVPCQITAEQGGHAWSRVGPLRAHTGGLGQQPAHPGCIVPAQMLPDICSAGWPTMEPRGSVGHTRRRAGWLGLPATTLAKLGHAQMGL